jgi:hypothetical protein
MTDWPQLSCSRTPFQELLIQILCSSVLGQFVASITQGYLTRLLRLLVLGWVHQIPTLMICWAMATIRMTDDAAMLNPESILNSEALLPAPNRI